MKGTDGLTEPRTQKKQGVGSRFWRTGGGRGGAGSLLLKAEIIFVAITLAVSDYRGHILDQNLKIKRKAAGARMYCGF